MTGITLAFLRYHWDEVYNFTRDGPQYVATAKYGQRDRLTANTPEQLLSMVRRHYRPPPAERCSTRPPAES